ncbi:UDP-glucose 4-epimerase [Marivirga sericea]|uniref:UDP-glucose 4-epimerase n=1 Tax=Marivirga sericea TaxID=1028 RepID=A0A1X7IBB7_9BACT|nr:UDP-glucose 4-epimerase GalE [Marivirga sericea]SMG11336.1 UDP-glucose 4-epimerase [Marivirga sericea]
MEDLKNILVTGGAGYIGSHTVVKLSEAGYRAIIVDDFRNSHQSVIENIQFLCEIPPVLFKKDCTDAVEMKKIFSTYPIEGVIHFAALKSVEESIEEPHAYFENNMNSLLLVTKLMNEFGVSKLVFSSSCTVYGENDIAAGINESCPLQEAKTPYGYSKQMAEKFLHYLIKSKHNQVKPIILRYFNPIGAHSSALIGENPIAEPKNLLPLICKSAYGLNGPIKVFGDDYDTKDGSCIRDFIHVVDLADAHIQALAYSERMEVSLDIFNVGTGEGHSVLELLEIFGEVNQVDVPIEMHDRREGDIPYIYADTQKIQSLLGWKPAYSIQDALRHSWMWQLKLVAKEDLILEL